MKKKYYLLLLVCFSLAFNSSFGQSIFNNPITDPNPSISNPFVVGQIVDANIVASGIGRGAGINGANAANRYNARSWNTAALDNTAYFEFTLNPNMGYEIDFISFIYTGQASGAGPNAIALRSSLDAYTSDIGVPTIAGSTIDLSAMAYQNISGPITFGIYAWGASSAIGTFSINDFTFNGIVGLECPLTTTWDGTMWTPALPDNTYSIVIDGDYDTATDGGSFDACSLFVNAGNTLAIQGTDYVQVTNDVTIDGTILVASEANFVQLDVASTVTLNGVGTGIVQKTTTPLQAYYSYTYWSSPFVNETLGEVGSGLDLVPVNRVFDYDASNFEDTDTDGFDDNSNDWAIATGPMIPGKGYAAFAQSSAMPFPQAQTYTFDGQFNNGQITTLVTVSVAAGDPNWNFLGNPYPSGLNAGTFLTHPANVGLDGTIYLWTHNSAPLGANPGPDNLNFSVDDYASYNPGTGGVAAVTGGTAPTGIIASGQGFFIEALTSSGVATFNNSMRVTTGNDDFFRATDRVWLNLENDYGAFSQILIGFVEGATIGVDRLYDGKRLDGGSYISFFSIIEDGHYAIQGLEELTEEKVIPLGIKNLVSGENEYRISIDNIEGILETSEIFLVDNLTNVTHDLNSGAYVFNSEEGIFKERFELLLRPEALSIIDNLTDDSTEDLMITKNGDGSLTFTVASNTEIRNIQIFDVLGRQLYDINITEQENQIRFKLAELNQVVFIAKATLANGNVLIKKGLK